MNEHMKQQQQAQANTTPSQPASPAKKNEDYIDFEEVK
jgi:hypothetical protein